MVRTERLRELMSERGLSQSELARRIGVSQAAIAKLVSGDSASSRYLHRIALELGTTSGYLTGETEDAKEGALPLPTPRVIAEQLDLVEVKQIDLAYGMGGAFSDEHVEVQSMHFPRLWLQGITMSAPSSLFFARGRGDSMQPTINDGDIILIDQSQNSVGEQDAIWALTTGPIAMVKRLRIRGSTVTIQSDNPHVSDDVAHADEVNIVGRVVFVGRRV